MAKLKVDTDTTLAGGIKVKMAVQIERDGGIGEGEIPEYKLKQLLKEAVDTLGPLVTKEKKGEQLELLPSSPPKPWFGWTVQWNGGLRR